jgi:lipopolysaccharide/colanic/teichoic acid biosynthesis glycosyltransferase
MSLKRTLDVACALAALAAAAPLMAIFAVAELRDGGPILYKQERVGRYGRRFGLLKFRSMRNAAGGPRLTIGHDARITPLGRLLRRSKLDELPQLVNVLRGDMSLVGPRPEVPEYVDPADPLHCAVLACRPGMTDPASIVFWREAELLAAAADHDGYYRTTLLPAKHRMSLHYARRASVSTDLLVIAWTACSVLRLVPRGSLPPRLAAATRPGPSSATRFTRQPTAPAPFGQSEQSAVVTTSGRNCQRPVIANSVFLEGGTKM